MNQNGQIVCDKKRTDLKATESAGFDSTRIEGDRGATPIRSGVLYGCVGKAELRFGSANRTRRTMFQLTQAQTHTDSIAAMASVSR